jgi:exodeoxyribonuclease VII large subunit
LETYTLFDLNEYIKRVIALNFQEPIWISCEIAQCKNNRGHYYLDLVQQNDKDEIIAQASAVIWYNSYLFLKNKLKDILDSLLKVGTEVKIKVRVEYNERFGLKYIIEDIDASYTLGQLEIKKQKIIDQLTEEKLIHLNREIVRPRVIKKLAVISSEEAAGFADFKKKLSENSYGYTYKLTFFKAAMQGVNTEREVVNALKEIQEESDKYDVIIIIRGGGSKLDLSYFDNYAIAKEIAFSNLAVLSGIGHDIDYSITDIVANKSFITPTAVADFIIENNLIFESEINDLVSAISGLTQLLIKDQQLALQSFTSILLELPKQILKDQKSKLDKMMSDMTYQKNYIFQNNFLELQKMGIVIELSHPDKIIKRGFTLLTDKNGKFVTSKTNLALSDVINIQLKDGKVEATVQSIN